MSRPNSAYLVETNPGTHLKWSTFVTPSIPVVTIDFAPGEHERPWPPTSSTLIYGLRDAVLVDSFITLEQARAQADWIASTGKNLTTIYATHGHGDHFFGVSVVLDRFPRARFVAAPSAIQVMKEQRRSSGNRVSRISSRSALCLPRNSGQMVSNWKAKD